MPAKMSSGSIASHLPSREWSLALKNRFSPLINLTEDDLPENTREKKSLENQTRKRIKNTAKWEADKYPNKSEQDTRLKVSLTMTKLMSVISKLNIMQIDIMMYNVNKKEFQKMANKIPDGDSLSMLAEQGSPGLEESSQQSQSSQASQELNWGCPIPNCSKSYKFENGLKNHIQKVHKGRDYEELPVSQEDNVFYDGEDDPVSKKRKQREFDDDSDGPGEKNKPRTHLSTILEEEDGVNIRADSLDMGLLDDSLTKSTQEVYDAAKEAYAKAEKVDVNIGELEDSLEEEEKADLDELRRSLKTKADLLHIRNAEIAELEASLDEMKESHDQNEAYLKKVKASRAEEMKKAKVEMEAKDKIIKDLKARNIAKAGRSKSPSKEKLKVDLDKNSTKMSQLADMVTKLQGELKEAMAKKKEAEVVTKKFDRMKVSLDKTTREAETIRRELEEYKRDMAKTKKRIPCSKPGCNTPRECEYSHLLKYEDRSEPREENWRKRIPCRYMSHPDGCKYSAEECQYSHDPEVLRRQNREASIEVLGSFEAGPPTRRGNWERGSRVPPPKRRRYGNNNDEKDDHEMTGNANGAEVRPRNSAPSQRLSRGSSTTSSGSAGGQRLGQRTYQNHQGQARKFSPIRSPEERPVRQSRRPREDMRSRLEEMQERRQRNRSMSRGPRGRSLVSQEKRFERYQRERRTESEDPWN